MLRQALSFLKGIGKDEFVSVASHNDADGISSSALMNSFLEKKRGRGADFISINSMPPQNLLPSLKTVISDRIIITDLAIADMPVIEKVIRMAPTLLIDHHDFSSFPKDKRLIYYNPRRIKKDIYQSASYLAFTLADRIVDMHDKIWIAVVGIVGDYDLSHSKDLLKRAKKEYPEITFDIHEMLRTDFGKIANIIYAVRSEGKTPMGEIVRIMSAHDSPGSFLSDRRVEKYIRVYERMNEEIERELKRFKAEAERSGDVIFFECRSKMNIISIIANIIAEENKDKVVAVYEITGNRVKFSIRNQEKRHDIGKLVREVASMVQGATGGGHPAAGGAHVPLSKLQEFKAELVRAVDAAKA